MNYYTVKNYAETSFTERHSEFIGYVKPVSSNDDAVNFINNIREKHRKATHNVYAYILRNDNITRYSDDGEPQGTAGIPVLNVLRKKNLTDVCCVVTRYFGGVLLGGGGLVRAYSHSASLTLDAAGIVHMCQCSRLLLKMDYSFYGKLLNILPDFNVKIVSTDFNDNISLELFILDEMKNDFKNKIVDLSANTVEILSKGHAFEEFN